MPLARGLARRLARDGDGGEDLAQVASIGLIKAIDRFEVERGHGFPSFAVPTIFGELKRHIRDFGWPVHVPRQVRDRAVRVRRASRKLELELARPPSSAELARECELSDAEVLEAMEADACARPAALGGAGAPGEEDPARSGWLGADDGGYDVVDYRDAVARRLRAASERDLRVLRLRLVDDLPQREIGRRLGISQMQVSRVLRRLLADREDSA